MTISVIETAKPCYSINTTIVEMYKYVHLGFWLAHISHTGQTHKKETMKEEAIFNVGP